MGLIGGIAGFVIGLIVGNFFLCGYLPIPYCALLIGFVLAIIGWKIL
jgi:hypothetical protein